MVSLSRTCSAVLGMIVLHCLGFLLLPAPTAAQWSPSPSASSGPATQSSNSSAPNYKAASSAAGTSLPLLALAGAGALFVTRS
ncbi:unnamed protein product [Polarella glacialis]|uniref:Uncharacterized protein n=1 Tax=Polarella glacialis TaxID=89957 RepID=A0A813GCY7_POLGL|nr:unnamed protein product [Polarella glacialis]